MNIAVVGCGKMGRMIEAVCARREDVQIAGFVGRGGCASLDELEEMDAALDFSHPDNLNGLLESAAREKNSAGHWHDGVQRRTGRGHSRGWAEASRLYGRIIFPVGVTVLGRLAAEAARMLGGGFDMEIVETHHRCKADAPSGTAKMLLRRVDPGGAYAVLNGREGRSGARGREIGVHAVRGGTVAGEHRLYFFGPMEELELRHRADSREIFALGALRAAAFANARPNGLYDMDDVIFGGT